MQNAEDAKNFVKGINSQNISGNQIFDPLQTEEPTPLFSLSNCLLEKESATIVRERLFFLLFWGLPRNLQVMRETFILIKE